MGTLAVVPIFVNVGAAVLPTVVTAVTSVVVLVLRPRDLLCLVRRRPVAAGVSVGAIAVVLASTIGYLTYARPPRPARTRQVLHYDWAKVASRAQERNVTLETNLGAVELVADRTRILQLLTNLLANAVQYNQEGGRVVLTIAQEGSEAVLNVVDTGVGIAAQDQPHVFERFFRADKARSREAGGSGLGLAICQSIVEAHYGSISFTSRPGEGTTFTVRLPLSRLD